MLLIIATLSVFTCSYGFEDDSAVFLSKDRYSITPWSSMPKNTTCTRNTAMSTVRCEMPIEGGGQCLQECSKHHHCDQAMLRHIDGNKMCYMKLNLAGECGDASILNLRQWSYYGSGWGNDNGEILAWTYLKKYAFTDVEVRWSGQLRSAYNTAGSATRWFFSFIHNGHHCTSGTVDFNSYHGLNSDYHKHAEFGGYCKNLPKGNVRIGFTLGPSTSGHSHVDSHTSHNGRCRVSMNEVDTRTLSSDDTCTLQSVFNIKEYIQNNLNDGRNSGNFLTYNYIKRAPGSSLRVRVIANMRGQSSNNCVRYSITFNGQECTNPAPIETAIYWVGGRSEQELRGRSMEGICHNIAAGTVTVGVTIFTCQTLNMMDAYSGWHSMSRLQVEEVRIGMPYVEYTMENPDENAVEISMPSQVFNIQYWFWKNLNDENDAHQILTVPYLKTRADSGIRVTINSNYRVRYDGTCTRYYFKFNNTECTNPGWIEASIYKNYWNGASKDHYEPNTISGMCNGLAIGTMQISFWSGSCHAWSRGDSTFGYYMTTNLIAEEVFFTNI